MKISAFKKSTVSLAFFLAFASLTASPSQANEYCGPNLWARVKNLARECIYRERTTGKNCGLIRVSGDRSATFILNDAVYRVRMEESAFSDGGDLDDLYVDRDDGCQLGRKNVLAYGNILQALAR
jgi:hypothetical protein